MKRKSFFYIHSVAGLVSALFIFLLSISGAALVFHDELDSLQQPKASNMQLDTILRGVNTCLGTVKLNYPNAMISNCDMSRAEEKIYNFSIYDSSYHDGKDAMQVFVDRNSNEILKTRGGSSDIKNNFMAWLSSFHNSFRLKKTGEWLLGVFAVMFIISLITGFILYRRSIISALFFRKKVWQRRNLHQLIGSWALIFNLMIGITGFWMQRYVFKKDFYADNSWTSTVTPTKPFLFNIDEGLKRITDSFPEFTPQVIYFAQSNKGKTAVYGSRSSNAFIHSKKFADVVSLDSSGAVAKTRFIDQNPPEDRYDIINSQIHFGKYGGWPVKVIYSVFGLLTALLSVTGILLWRRRISLQRQ